MFSTKVDTAELIKLCLPEKSKLTSASDPEILKPRNFLKPHNFLNVLKKKIKQKLNEFTMIFSNV